MWSLLVSREESLHVIGLDRLWVTKVNLQKSSKRLEADNHHHPRYHQTCLSPDDKRDFDSLWIGRVRATICWLPVSLDLLSLDGEGADNHEVSPHAIRPSSHDSRIVCTDNHKVCMLSDPRFTIAKVRLFAISTGRRRHLREGYRWPHWSLRVNGLTCLLLMKGIDNP